MKHYTKGQFTATFFHDDGVPATTLTAILSQLKPGAVIDDLAVDPNGPFAGTRRLIVNYREPAEKGPEMGISREPDKYASITLTDDNPILPDTVKKILDQMPAFSDICEMRITSKDGPIPTRTVAIYYTTVMPGDTQ